MPKFIVASENAEGVERCEEVIEFPDLKAATDDAQIALAEMAREKLPNGKSADFGVSVENDAGKEVYRARLHFAAKNEDDLDCESNICDAAADDVASKLAAGPRD